MTEDEEGFAIDLTGRAKDHADWLKVMQFGMSALLTDAPFLVYLICQQAEKEKATGNGPDYWTVSDYARDLFIGLGLNIIPKRPEGGSGGG